MSKKTAYIIIIAFILLIAGGFLAFYFYTNRGQGNNIAGTETRGNIFPSSPTNTTGQTPTSETAPTASGQTATSGQAAPVLKELSLRPSAGAVALSTSSPNGPMALVRFVERGTGNVYEVSPQDDTESRLSNTTIPKIEEALWRKDGGRLLVRYAGEDGESIKTYGASLKSQTGQNAGGLEGSFLTDNIRTITANPDQNKIFYLLENSNGSTGIFSEFDGSRKNQIFDSLLQEWQVAWPTASQIALTTKPSSGVPGFLFLLNTGSGTLTRAISGVQGLTAKVNPTGKLVLYSESNGAGLNFKIYNLKNGSATDASVATLPEKCLWSKNDPETIYCAVPSYLTEASYPDDWYKGLVSFSDDIWKIDSQTGGGQLVAKLKTAAGKDIDGVNLFMSPKENYLFFTNKNDFHLWSLRLVP